MQFATTTVHGAQDYHILMNPVVQSSPVVQTPSTVSVPDNASDKLETNFRFGDRMYHANLV